MKKLFPVLVAIGLAAAPVAGHSQVIYTDGPINGQNNAWPINWGFSVASQFTISSSGTVTSADFGTWNWPGDLLSTVNWTISTDSGSNTIGSAVGSGTASASSVFDFQGLYGYNIYTDTISLPSVALAAGAYWFQLDTAVINNNSGNSIYWDINSGSPHSWENGVGYDTGATYPAGGYPTPSTQFTLYGGGSSPVPEPASLALLGVGLLAVGAIRYRHKMG